MNITFEKNLFVARGAGDLRHDLHMAGWNYNKLYVGWTTSRVNLAAKFAQHCSGEAKERVDSYVADKASAIADSIAVESALEVPTPDGREFRAYQKAAIEFAIKRQHVLIADGPRLGKTPESIGVINMLPDTKRVLVVTPVKINWEREMAAWLYDKKLSVGVVYGQKAEGNPATDVLIMNWELLPYHKDYLLAQEWDIVILDEAHRLGNPASKSTKICLGTLPRKGPLPTDGLRAKKFIFLTGTPMYTRPIQLWPMIRVLDPYRLGANWWDFTKRYCDAKDGDVSGYSNLEELQFEMRRHAMIRRTKEDVAERIPTTREVITIPAEGLERLVRAETAYVRTMAQFQWLVRAHDGVGTTPNEDQTEDAITENTPRQDLGLAKVGFVSKYVADLIGSGERIILFAHHRSVVNALHEELPTFGKVIGGMGAAQKQAVVDAFQAGNHDGLICNIAAASEGLAMHRADMCIFAEMSWVPAQMDQAEERIWDVLKVRGIAYRYMAVAGSLDETMGHVMRYRKDQIDRAMNHRRLGFG